MEEVDDAEAADGDSVDWLAAKGAPLADGTVLPMHETDAAEPPGQPWAGSAPVAEEFTTGPADGPRGRLDTFVTVAPRPESVADNGHLPPVTGQPQAQPQPPLSPRPSESMSAGSGTHLNGTAPTAPRDTAGDAAVMDRVRLARRTRRPAKEWYFLACFALLLVSLAQALVMVILLMAPQYGFLYVYYTMLVADIGKIAAVAIDHRLPRWLFFAFVDAGQAGAFIFFSDRSTMAYAILGVLGGAAVVLSAVVERLGPRRIAYSWYLLARLVASVFVTFVPVLLLYYSAGTNFTTNWWYTIMAAAVAVVANFRLWSTLAEAIPRMFRFSFRKYGESECACGDADDVLHWLSHWVLCGPCQVHALIGHLTMLACFRDAWIFAHSQELLNALCSIALLVYTGGIEGLLVYNVYEGNYATGTDSYVAYALVAVYGIVVFFMPILLLIVVRRLFASRTTASRGEVTAIEQLRTIQVI